MGRSTLIDLNPDKLHYNPFIMTMNRCDGNCDTVEDPFGRTWFPYEMEDMKLKVFNTIKLIKEPTTITKQISKVGKVTRGKNRTTISFSVSVKNHLKFAHLKKIMPGILVNVLLSITKIMSLLNI